MPLNIREWIKNKYLLIILLFIVLIGVNCFLSIKFSTKLVSRFVNLGLPAKLVEHYNTLGSFTISLPETWAPTDLIDGNHGDKSVVLIVRNTAETLYIDVSKYANVKSQSEIENLAIEKLSNENQKTYKLISLEKYLREKDAGVLHEYAISNLHPFWGRRSFHCLGWYINPKPDVGFSFSFCVEEKDWEKAKNTFITIINSIDFK